MATLPSAPSIIGTRSVDQGARQHIFTVAEYHRMAEAGVFHEDDPIELLEGRLFIKLDNGPPYEVPLGIPPDSIAGPDVPPYPQRKFTVREYHKLLKCGALPPQLRTELVEGWVVEKMTRNAAHDSSLQRTLRALLTRLDSGWEVRLQSAVVLDEAEPEPDIAVVPGPAGRFDHEHPRPHEIALVIEVSDSTLSYDRGAKLRDYARNSIARYWIVNLIERVVEAYEAPSGPVAVPGYGKKQIFRLEDTVPLIVREQEFAPVLAEQLFPSL
jgi:Uma2 family endonuclease